MDDSFCNGNKLVLKKGRKQIVNNNLALFIAIFI